MKIITPLESFSKLYRKQAIDGNAFETFLGALKELFNNNIKDGQYEQTQRKFFTTFIEKIIPNSYLVTHEEDGIDLVVHTGEGTNSPKGVLFELKSTTNKDEMVTTEEINRKALHELLFYYLNERIDKQNISLKYLFACNINECFVWDAQVFENAFAKNKPLLKEYDDFKNGRLDFTEREKFYEKIAKRYIEEVKESLDFTYINIRDCYKKYQRNNEKALTPLFKLLNVTFLMKIPVKNDSNELDKDFYRELLYIMGIEEWVKKNGDIHRIRRIKSGAQKFSLMEQIWSRLDDYNDLKNDEVRFEIAMGLLITWINRILFLKLLESQLICFKKGEDVKFLTSERIPDYDVLHDLFMKVLAKPISERDEEIKERFPSVPYLNSSLFEISPLEQKYFSIGMLRLGEMDIYRKTILKNSRGNRQTGRISALTYLLSFLDAYDFGSSEVVNGIKKEKKTLINASVLGLIFEKINGYKDGSFFTPGYITEYICNKTIRRAVIDKFNEAKGWDCANFDELKEKINGGRREERNEANEIINSLKICDPAVGSGHFLVSALNEIIAIKSDLGVLQDRKPIPKPIREYDIKVEYDELVVVDEDGDSFKYKPSEPASQRIQETLFEEKRTIIENCLFGVDINPKSVEICRLRLWIELLKSAYYYQADNGERYLQTLPNIDINIKCGNSLAAKYLLNTKLGVSKSVKRYKKAVAEYKRTSNKEKKYDINYNIAVIKSEITRRLEANDKDYQAIVKLEDRYLQLTETFSEDMFGYTQKQIKARDREIKRLKKEIEQRRIKFAEKKGNKDFSTINAFEWRIEFPEVLDDEGNFIGFDCIIGNPPYISLEDLPREVSVYNRMYKPSNHGTTEPIYVTLKAHGDIYTLFVERGLHILREGGHLSYIIPNKWEKVMYGKPLRELFLRKNLTQLIDFCDNQIFEDATTYTCIIRMKNEKNKGRLQVSTIYKLQKEMLAPDVEERKEEFDTTKMDDDIWVTSSLLHFNMVRKFRREMKPLLMYDGMASYRGILSGLSTAFNISVNKANELIAQDIRSKDILRPFLQGRGLVAYGKAEAGSYLIFIPKGFTALQMGIDRRTQPLPSEEDAWGWFCTNYKAVAEWLFQFKNEASERGDKGDYWWELRACTYYNKFEMPKIFYQVFQVKPCFVYDESSTFCNNSMWFITVPDKALLALLCSKVGWWLISEHCPPIQNGYQLIWDNFSSIPVPKQLPEVLSEYADKMMQVRNDEAAFNALSDEVDKIVYGLYGITDL